MIRLATFASSEYVQSADLCATSATRQGADAATIYLPNDTEDPKVRGCGYWKFKPRIILAEMALAKDGDLIIYSDAGIEFLEPVQTVIDKMDQDIFLFGNQHLHAHWCKRDIIDAICTPARVMEGKWSRPATVDPDGITWDSFGTQVQASVIFFRVNDYTRKFVKEWLDWCLFENGRLIDDSPSRTPNHPEFKENRHDQAILTTLAYREGIKLHEWYVKYEDYTPVHLAEYEKEFERPLYFHHRWRNADWEARGIAA